MTDHNPAELRRLFDLANATLPNARGALLDRECAGDAALRRRLEVMLAAAEDERFLAAPTGSESEMPAPLHEGPGTRIGPYTLLQQIGEGGFGVVFLAEQEQPVARKVALKIIKLGMDTRQVVARFEQERQALAIMDHPHIARVIDAGATETGRPYFVMELVQGEPISNYCDKHGLTIDERLELFEQVCGAVQHAHSKGIIHRDLKPSNILVGTQDGRAHAKVIDFGIAKATAAKLTDKTVFTEQHQVIGTFQYMSPEQAEGSLDIDTRTDVYALGVVLYELLTGSTPFDAETLRSAVYSEIQRMIREVDPPKPSTRLGESHGTLASIAALRRVEPKRLGMLIRGELDWIVMKALEKDRARRYESASGLAQDIRRYLGGEAVVAAPPSAVYQLRKFTRRNRGTVLACSAVAVALLVGVIAFAWQASVARAERDNALRAQTAEAEQRRIADEQKVEAVRQQGLAEANAAAEAQARKRAEATVEFVTDALQSSDPNQGGEQGISVADAMMQAVELLDQGAFGEEPDIEAELRKVIAEILHRNGRVADALPLAERALSIFEGLDSGHARDVAVAINQVATIQQDLGNFAQAEPLFERALELLQELEPGDHVDVSMGLNNLALVRCYLGRYAEAEPLLVQSLEMKQRLYSGDHEDLAMGLNNLAGVHDNLGRDEEATALYEQSLAMYDRLFDDHPQLAMGLFNLGQQRIPQGRLAESQELLERALEMYRRLFHGDHPDVARAISGVANIQRIIGRLAQAEALNLEALEMKQRLFPGDHPDVAGELQSLALLRQELGKLSGAAETAERAVAMRRVLHAGDHPQTARALDLLAGVRRDQDRLQEAQSLLAESLQMQRRLHGGDHADVARAMNRVAAALEALGRLTEGEALSLEALEMLRRVYPGDHPRVASGMASLGLILFAAKRFQDAEPLFRECLEMNRRYYGGDHYDVAQSLLHFARTLHALGRREEARQAFDEAVAMNRRRTPNGSPHLAAALWRSGSARLDDGDAAAALPEIEEALAQAEQTLAPDSPQLVRYRESLEKCRQALGR